MENNAEPMDKGPQPLDQLLNALGLQNSDLVDKSAEQLTFKMLAKGRRGRRLTLNAQMKILRALNACQSEKQYVHSDLFNYQGK